MWVGLGAKSSNKFNKLWNQLKRTAILGHLSFHSKKVSLSFQRRTFDTRGTWGRKKSVKTDHLVQSCPNKNRKWSNKKESLHFTYPYLKMNSLSFDYKWDWDTPSTYLFCGYSTSYELHVISVKWIFDRYLLWRGSFLFRGPIFSFLFSAICNLQLM